jgi:hypothetical protein
LSYRLLAPTRRDSRVRRLRSRHLR